MGLLADALDYFNDVDNEILRLREQAIAIYRRVEGSLTPNVAVGEFNLGLAYGKRADRAHVANDLDRCIANLELALPHYREAARIYSTTNRVDNANEALRKFTQTEDNIQHVRIKRAEAPESSNS